MHSRIASCPTTTAQCRGIAHPSSSSLSFVLPSIAASPVLASATRQPKIGNDSCNAGRVICSSSHSTSTGSAAAAGSRGKSERVSSSPRATLQESSVSLAVTNGAAATENGASILVDPPSDRLRHHHPSHYIGFGSLLENGSFFRERFVIRFSEAGPRGTITLETFSSLLQEAATNHVIAMDYAFTPSQNFDGPITVTTRMHVEVDRYPAWRDLLEIDTWFQREGKNAVRRDWTVKDVNTGEEIAFATSTWVLMNTLTRRLTKVTEEKWAELQPHLRHPPRWALSEGRRNASSMKIAKLGEDAAYKIPGLVACEKDCDMNQHVNNVRYMGWMLEGIPEDVKCAYEVSKITLEYRQEASQGQVVESVAEPEEPASNTTRQFTHLIKTSEVGKEINRGRTVWRPLQ